MQTYLVGGAVRDALLGLTVKDRDWVVVGATPEHMLAAGYTRVGAEFPVFLHPQSGEEYALARTERKRGHGYTGFVCDSHAQVTLEEDLQRRDLTINAMAQADDGTLIDPWGGLADLKAGTLRHVSPAFVEDPLRVLRVARFFARFGPLGFSIAPDTLALMRELVNMGELEYLTPERVWQEMSGAFNTASPRLFFEALRECGALRGLLPEIDALWGIPQPERFHPEIDTGEHLMMALDTAARLMAAGAFENAERLAVLYAVLLHDTGKALTPSDQWPSHPDHEPVSAHIAETLSERLRVPNLCRQLAVQVSRYHTHAHRAFELRPATLMRMLESVDYLRRPRQLTLFLEACRADALGRGGDRMRGYAQADYIDAAAEAARRVNALDVQATTGLVGKALGDALRQRRIDAIAVVRRDFIGPAVQPAPQ